MNYSNFHQEIEKTYCAAPTSEKDRQRLRELAKAWMDAANKPEMAEKKKAHRALKDLKPIRPVIVFETLSVNGFVTEDELECEDAYLKNVERMMLYTLKQHALGDDTVIEPYFRIAWKVMRSDYGVEVVEHHASDSMAYVSNFPIQEPSDIDKLKEREFHVNRGETLGVSQKIEEIFGDILPVKVGNYDNFFVDTGFNPFTGNNFVGITMDLFKLCGYENMSFWAYDCPQDLHRVLRFLCDDRIRFFKWLKAQGLMVANTDNQFAGPSSYGYVSELAQVDDGKTIDFKDVWTWPESQETTPISPAMFDEFYLPYIAEVANMFGMSYYGCCEPVHDRLSYIIKALPNLRSVSIAGWTNMEQAAEIMGNKFVCSRKPTPSYISGKSPNWELARKDIENTVKSFKNGIIEFVVRDVYDINGDMPRLKQWVDMTKSIING